jgi:hypothetical protein
MRKNAFTACTTGKNAFTACTTGKNAFTACTTWKIDSLPAQQGKCIHCLHNRENAFTACTTGKMYNRKHSSNSMHTVICPCTIYLLYL